MLRDRFQDLPRKRERPAARVSGDERLPPRPHGAREGEICYATLALVTDWDCWREATEAVSVEAVLAVLADNADAARRTMREAVSRVEGSRSCACRDALRDAILTDPKAIPEATRERLRPIAGRYF